MKPKQILSRLHWTWRSANKVQLMVLLALVAVGLVSSLTAVLIDDQQTWGGFLLNLGTEMVGSVVTYILLQEIVGTSSRKADLIAQMGSSVRDVAIAAAEELKRQSWLTDGSLRRAFLIGADLQGASLMRADLQEANLSTAQHLETANLDRAIADSETKWPEGFQVPDTVVTVGD